MGWLETFGAWLIEQILKYLLNTAITEVQKWYDEVELDKKRGIINDANSKKYEEARDRAARRKAALDLLNRSSEP